MKERQCEVIRCELDELTLGDEGSTAVTQHLRECGECREFHQKQTRLRQIVGSLGPVEAPPDFDFRLRALPRPSSSETVNDCCDASIGKIVDCRDEFEIVSARSLLKSIATGVRFGCRTTRSGPRPLR